MGNDLKEIVILHSNDIHGQFAGKTDELGRMCHSTAQVAGYVSSKKAENPCTFYCIAGDAFQGSLIDSEFLGLSTIDILNMSNIDVMALGNHELDYGISHMMFVAKFAEFPIINANFKMKTNGRNLFKPQHRIRRDGMEFLFIGLLTPDIVDQTRAEGLVGSYVTVEDSKAELEKIVKKNAEKGFKPNLTILMTHIGYEQDLELARSLDPELGVDIILGGHTHTYPEAPVVENGILVLQAGMENTHIGELHAFVDTEKNKIEKWEWKMVPVDEDHCERDKFVRAMVGSYVYDIDEKYGSIITRFRRELDNYGRGNTTELGQVITDAFAEALGFDIMFTAASSIRCYKMDMTVTHRDIREAYPYDGSIHRLKVNGRMLENMVRRFLRDEVLDDWKDAFFHTSKNLKIKYNRTTKELNLSYLGKPVEADQVFVIGMQDFYYINAKNLVDYSCEELSDMGGNITAAADAFEVLTEYLKKHSGLGGPVDDRITIIS